MRMNYVDGLQFLKDNQIYKPDGTTYEYGDVRNIINSIIINFMRPQNTKSTSTSLMIYVGLLDFSYCACMVVVVD